jgi:sec-independent protein translocase protein TatB
MFEIGFWELVLVSVVALLVFGPERLPGLLREVFGLIRRIQYLASSARDQIQRELELDELRQTLNEQKRLLHDTLEEVEEMEKRAEPKPGDTHEIHE